MSSSDETGAESQSRDEELDVTDTDLDADTDVDSDVGPEEAATPTRAVLGDRLRLRGLKIARVLGVLAVALLGGFLGWTLAPTTSTTLGPLTLGVEVRPSMQGGAVVELPPVGSVSFDTHTGPLLIQGDVEEVDVDAAQDFISSPAALEKLEDEAPAIVIKALGRSVALGVGFALIGAAGAGYLVYRTKKRTIASLTVVAVAISGVGATTAATFDSDSLAQPQFEGLLSQAPYISTAGLDAVDRLESYRSGLSDFVQSVTALYTTAENLPVLPHDDDITVALHVSDIHLNPLSYDLIDQLVDQFNVDLVIDTGDVTSWGTAAESATLAPIGDLDVPYVFVAGNHDSAETAQTVASFPNAVVLNNDVETVAGLTLAGIADPRFLPDDNSGSGVGLAAGKQLVTESTERLSETVQDYNSSHEDDPVDAALIHDPSGLDSMFGEVPLVLAGHYHRRIDTLDVSGTRVRAEGSTGGAGITSKGLERLSEGDPVPMEASLLYFASDGEREGELLAYDEITVGGLGLTSVNLSRGIVDPDQEPDHDESSESIIPEQAGVDLPDASEAPEPEGGSASPKTTESSPEPNDDPDRDRPSTGDEDPTWPARPIQPRPEFEETPVAGD